MLVNGPIFHFNEDWPREECCILTQQSANGFEALQKFLRLPNFKTRRFDATNIHCKLLTEVKPFPVRSANFQLDCGVKLRLLPEYFSSDFQIILADLSEVLDAISDNLFQLTPHPGELSAQVPGLFGAFLNSITDIIDLHR